MPMMIAFAVTLVMIVLMLALSLMVVIVPPLAGHICVRIGLHPDRLRLRVIAADGHAGCRADRRADNGTGIAAHFFPDKRTCCGAHCAAHDRTGISGDCRCSGEQQSCQQ